MLFTPSIIVAPLVLLLSPFAQAGLSCATDPSSSCDASAYCKWTSNNEDCTIAWTDSAVFTFKECVSSSTCQNGGSCVNGLCCITSHLPNGASDCPTSDQLLGCCFEKNLAQGGSLYQPKDMARPSELNCGC